MIKFLYVLIIIFLISGCSYTSTKKIRKETLSSAASKASEKDEEKRKVEDEEVICKETNNHSLKNYSKKECPKEKIKNTETDSDSLKSYFDLFIISSGYEINLYSNELKQEKLYFFSYKAGYQNEDFYKKRFIMELSLKAGSIELIKSNFTKSLKNPKRFEIEFNMGFDTLKIYDLSLNTGFGLSIGTLSWQFENPLHDSNEKIYRDYIGNFCIPVFAKIIFCKKDFPYLSIGTIGKLILFNSETNEGFTNDLFNPGLGLGLKAEFGYTF